VLRSAFRTPADIAASLCFQPGWDLPCCLRSFASTLRVMQSAAALERIAYELCEDLAADGVWYAEVRYCPSLHRAAGLADEAIVAAVGRGLQRASAELSATGWGAVAGDGGGEGGGEGVEGEAAGRRTVRCRFYQLLTILRDLGPDEAMVVAQLAVRSSATGGGGDGGAGGAGGAGGDAEDALRTEYGAEYGAECDGGDAEDALRVVGIDLAGNEHAHPPELFAAAFEAAHASGTLGITVHAGEAGGGSNGDDDGGKGAALEAAAAANIVTAVERLHATRIGHGVAAASDAAVMALLRDRGVTVEVCPTSNVHTGAVRCCAEHPAALFLRRGIAIVPCADNTLLSATSTGREYEALMMRGGGGDGGGGGGGGGGANAPLTQAEAELVAARSAASGFAVSRGGRGTARAR
jgi:adenosine deaminase